MVLTACLITRNRARRMEPHEVEKLRISLDSKGLERLLAASTGDNEVDAYMASNDSSLDILGFWRNKSSVMPKLATVAHPLLAVPATSTPSERAFWLAERTLEERLTQLSADTVVSLLFLHCNNDV